MNIQEQIQKLDADALIELFELDTTVIGGTDHFYFHAGTNKLNQPVVWQGITYQPFPIEAEGFDRTVRGALPRPRLRVANVASVISAVLMELDDLVGAKVIRRQTFARYLDEVNFPAPKNRLLRTEDLANTGVWTRNRIASVSSTWTSPGEKVTLNKLVASSEGGVANLHYLTQTVSGLADNVKMSASVLVRKAELPRVNLILVSKTGAGTVLEYRFDDERVTCSVMGTGQADLAFSVQKEDYDLYRLKIENWSTLSGTTLPSVQVRLGCDPGIGDPLWAKGAATATRDAVISPIEGWTADALIETTTTAAHYASATLTLRANRRYRARACFKALGAGAVRYGILHLSQAGGALPNVHAITIDLVTGVITNLWGSEIIYYSVEGVGDGWFLVILDFIPTADGTSNFMCRLSDVPNSGAPSYTGDGVSGMYVAAPYAWDLHPDVTEGMNPYVGPFAASSAASLIGDDLKGVYAGAAQIEVGALVTDYQRNVSTVSGNPDADPNQHLDDDVFYVERKLNENKVVVEFELASAMDLLGVRLPARLITTNYCWWQYRGEGCGYIGTNYFNSRDEQVGTAAEDSCSKSIQGCKKRFGAKAKLPFGGFPGARAYKL